MHVTKDDTLTIIWIITLIALLISLILTHELCQKPAEWTTFNRIKRNVLVFGFIVVIMYLTTLITLLLAEAIKDTYSPEWNTIEYVFVSVGWNISQFAKCLFRFSTTSSLNVNKCKCRDKIQDSIALSICKLVTIAAISSLFISQGFMILCLLIRHLSDDSNKRLEMSEMMHYFNKCELYCQITITLSQMATFNMVFKAQKLSQPLSFYIWCIISGIGTIMFIEGSRYMIQDWIQRPYSDPNDVERISSHSLAAIGAAMACLANCLGIVGGFKISTQKVKHACINVSTNCTNATESCLRLTRNDIKDIDDINNNDLESDHDMYPEFELAENRKTGNCNDKITCVHQLSQTSLINIGAVTSTPSESINGINSVVVDNNINTAYGKIENNSQAQWSQDATIDGTGCTCHGHGLEYTVDESIDEKTTRERVQNYQSPVRLPSIDTSSLRTGDNDLYV